MTTKAKEPEPTPAKTTGGPTESPEEAARDVRQQTEAARKRQAAAGMCVVDDGTAHFADGRAIPGADICSAHEINYFRDGTPRRG